LKNFTFLAFVVFFLFTTLNSVVAQKNTGSKELLRCGTMEAIDKNLQSNPAFRAQYEKGLKDVENSKNLINGRFARIDNLTGPVTIPVVVHIVLPNPNFITDADVQYFINRLNLDFSGLNPDSANGSPFFNLRGHSLLRFVLARRTPAGAFTTGIERKSGTTIIGTNTYQPIKHLSDGGLDPWDVTQYYNVWVGLAAGGLLGIAPGIGVGNQTETTASTTGIDGVCINAVTFTNNPCYTDPDFNLARTAVHEVGHNFGLFHSFGGGCAGTDFQQLTTGQTLPAALLVPADDVPQHSAPTGGCPTGAQATGCAAFPNPPGKMYQNYMDYTNDACMTMFSKGQVDRMHYLIENFRPGYLTTQGHLPPASMVALDAAPLASVNPGGFEVSGCGIINYPSILPCAGNVTPRFRVTNYGSTTITSLTVGYRFNNGTAVTQSISVNIPTGASYVHAFSTSVSVPIGSHTFKFFTSQPNGGTDQTPANDTLTQGITVNAPSTVPVAEGFESTTFPANGWSVSNPNGDFTWQRTTPGRTPSAGKASINNYDIDATGNIDELRSPSITVSAANAYAISYDIAHKNYPGSNDVLAILVSTNCGQTFTQIYSAAGTALATAGSSTAGYTAPAAGDWVTRTVNIPAALLSSGQILVAFRNTTDFGNWIHLDNVNIVNLGNRDLRMVSINSPGATSCSPNIVPSVTIANDGTETITSFKIGYRLNASANTITTFTQTIAPGGTATLTLPAGAAASGTNTITAFTADPVSTSGTGDARASNDTLSKTFGIANLISPPVVEGFENAFPPAGWTINNPNANVTWIRKAPGRNSAFSAFIDNYNNNLIGQNDELRIPFMNVAGADSVIITFDLAHKNYPGSLDVLSLQATTDCGTTFTPIYSKSGATLATAGSSTADYQAPIATDWRNERIALGGAILTSGSLGINFRNTNDYGNNIFVDNINITGLFKRDLRLVSINAPGTLTCSNSITPAVTVRNVGSETITAFKVSYSVNGGAPQTQNITGVTLTRDAQQNVTLPVGTLAGPGSYTLRIYSWDPVTTSGTGDQNRSNDTLTRTVFVPGTTTAPLAETFASTTFPPANWSVLNPDGAITWRRSPLGSSNIGSAFMNTYNYPTLGQKDDLLTPIINFGPADSVRLQFDLSAVTYSYPGSTAIPIDTLEVVVSRDCGNSFTTVYKKWGNELQTIGDPNSPQDVEFFPTAQSQWRRETIELTPFVNQSPMLVMFRVSNNFENNIFIDNVDFFTLQVPQLLKQQGYLVYPTAFRNSFTVRHYQTPSTLKFINVVNSAGQTVWTKQFSGNSSRQIEVDLTGKAAGVYVVEVGYTDGNRNIVQRVTKY
jgi:hypothetical protein